MSNIQGPKKSYIALIDEQIEKEQAAERASEKPSYYPLRPSSAGYCTTKIGYDLAAYEGVLPRMSEVRKPSVVRLLSLGHSIEGHAIRFIAAIPGFKVKYKQAVVDMFNLPSGKLFEGSIDLVIEEEDTGNLCLADLKSVGNGWNAAFKSRWDGVADRLGKLKAAVKFSENAIYVEDPVAFLDELGEDALGPNIIQMNLYAFSSFFSSRKLTHCSVIRYEKNSSQMFEVRFKPCKKLFEHTKNKMSLIETTVEAAKKDKDNALSIVSQLPKDYLLGSMACAFCPYQSRCWPNATSKEKWAGGSGKKWAAKVGELEKSAEIEALFEQLQPMCDTEAKKKSLEDKLSLLIYGHDVTKVKRANGEVWEIVFLKSPKPHLELRRSKE